MNQYIQFLFSINYLVVVDNLVTNKFSGDKEQKIGNLLLKISARQVVQGLSQYLFDTSFPNSCLLVLATENDGVASAQVYMQGWDKTGFKANCTINGGAFYFLAIGY